MTLRAQTPTASTYEMLIQAVVDYAIFMLDPEGHVMSWNPGARRLKGYSAEEIIGEHFSRFHTPEDRAAGLPHRALETAKREGRFSTEGWRVRKDGSRFWAMVVIDPILREGELVGFAKITRDMTEQHEAQQAALDNERNFRLLVEGVTDYAIYMLSPEGCVTSWNAGAERIKGYLAPEIIGKHFSRFYLPEDVSAGLPWRALDIARREGRYEAEGWRQRKDGTHFWAGVVIDAIRENGRLLGFAKITRDLTERREAQLQLQQSREQLFQAQKMESLGQLTGGLAHDFNNLLTGIMGSLELLQAQVARGQVQNLERFVVAAQGAASRAAALTHRLLAFARRQTLDPKPTDPNRLIAGMEDLVQRTVGPEITLHAELDPDLWPTLCDPNQLENAILNLCINARDAMPGGGVLTLRTGNTTLDLPPEQESDLQPGEYVVIRVADTGTGMSPETLQRAFDPFFTTKPLGQGTGLGLSMIYGFARQSDGQVRITSELGAGTEVCIYLPRYRGEVEEEEAEAHRRRRQPRPEGGRRVLVVDDEPTVRMLAGEVLKELGHAAIEATDATSGLKVLQSDLDIDLLVTDVGLPGGMNGRQLADAARQLRPGLRVLFITGYAENATLNKEQLEPGMHMLVKPFTMEALADRITEVLSAP